MEFLKSYFDTFLTLKRWDVNNRSFLKLLLDAYELEKIRKRYDIKNI